MEATQLGIPNLKTIQAQLFNITVFILGHQSFQIQKMVSHYEFFKNRTIEDIL